MYGLWKDAWRYVWYVTKMSVTPIRREFIVGNKILLGYKNWVDVAIFIFFFKFLTSRIPCNVHMKNGYFAYNLLWARNLNMPWLKWGRDRDGQKRGYKFINLNVQFNRGNQLNFKILPFFEWIDGYSLWVWFSVLRVEFCRTIWIDWWEKMHIYCQL